MRTALHLAARVTAFCLALHQASGFGSLPGLPGGGVTVMGNDANYDNCADTPWACPARDCDDKVAKMAVYGVSSLVRAVPRPRAGRPDSLCPNGKCCRLLHDMTAARCDLAALDWQTSSGAGRLVICYYDYADNKCKAETYFGQNYCSDPAIQNAINANDASSPYPGNITTWPELRGKTFAYAQAKILEDAAAGRTYPTVTQVNETLPYAGYTSDWRLERVLVHVDDHGKVVNDDATCREQHSRSSCSPSVG